jgi:hypothetical protein
MRVRGGFFGSAGMPRLVLEAMWAQGADRLDGSLDGDLAGLLEDQSEWHPASLLKWSPQVEKHDVVPAGGE